MSAFTPKTVLRLAVSDPSNQVLIDKYRSAVEEWNKKQASSRDFDAGFDLYVPGNIAYNVLEHKVCIDFGIKAYMVRINPDNGEEEPVCFMMVPRSSLGAKTPLRMANSIGIIDSGYRGELKGYFDNMYAYMSSPPNDFEIKPLDRFIQVVGGQMEKFSVELLSSISTDTQRGVQGFGSSGR